MKEPLRRLRRVSIRWKVVAIVLAVAFLSLILVGAGQLWQARLAFERQMQHKLVLLADVIGLNSTAALAFNDPVAATETLAALGSDAHVMAASLYDAHGKLFARYTRSGLADASSVDTGVPKDGWALNDERAVVVRTIRSNNREFGTIRVIADTEEWTTILRQLLGVTGLLFTAVLIVGFFVSIWMQRLVTHPITELADIAKRIGQERDYSLRAVKQGDDEIGTLVVGFNGMLDEIQHAEQTIRKFNEELERRVFDRTAQLEAANKELESFSYSVSHDLRAPLRAIDGFSRILLDDYGAKLDAEGRENLERVRRAAQRMGVLIDDMLKLARVSRTEPSLEEVDLSALAQDVMNALQNQEPERRVDIALMPELKVWGDPRLLRIALENLLGNAWKFTGGKPDARIELGVEARDDKPVYYVRDNGAGFDMAYVEKLFAPFQRLHTVAEFPGTGVGLATVQRIVLKHGGRIWVEAAVNKGAAFFFTLEQRTTNVP